MRLGAAGGGAETHPRRLRPHRPLRPPPVRRRLRRRLEPVPIRLNRFPADAALNPSAGATGPAAFAGEQRFNFIRTDLLCRSGQAAASSKPPPAIRDLSG